MKKNIESVTDVKNVVIQNLQRSAEISPHELYSIIGVFVKKIQTLEKEINVLKTNAQVARAS